MARERFVAERIEIPQEYKFDQFYLVPITTDIVEEDRLTLTSNADAITQQRGGDGDKNEWPYVCSLEENMKDLAWLEVCAKYKQLFSYVIRRTDDNSYAGCIYIYPIELFFPEKAQEKNVDFSFWITQKEYDSGNYESIFNNLVDWLQTSWGFKNEEIFLRNREIPESLR